MFSSGKNKHLAHEVARGLDGDIFVGEIAFGETGGREACIVTGECQHA